MVVYADGQKQVCHSRLGTRMERTRDDRGNSHQARHMSINFAGITEGELKRIGRNACPVNGLYRYFDVGILLSQKVILYYSVPSDPLTRLYAVGHTRVHGPLPRRSDCNVFIPHVNFPTYAKEPNLTMSCLCSRFLFTGQYQTIPYNSELCALSPEFCAGIRPESGRNLAGIRPESGRHPAVPESGRNPAGILPETGRQKVQNKKSPKHDDSTMGYYLPLWAHPFKLTP